MFGCFCSNRNRFGERQDRRTHDWCECIGKGNNQWYNHGFDGKFSIPDVPSNATLVVSYIGYLTKEVKSGKDLVIVLEEDNKTLDEVVVIGYGTVKRRDLTGSVASVTGEN